MVASASPTPGDQPVVPRRTIGLLTARIGRAWGREFIAGITDAASQLDINLRCFVCRDVAGSDFSLYNLVDPASLDGLIRNGGLSPKKAKTYGSEIMKILSGSDAEEKVR